MKKYLLTLALSIIGFIGFSNAGSITLTSDGESYNPSSIYIENVNNFLESYSISISNNGNECGLFIYGGDSSCYYNSENNTNCSIPLEAGEYWIIDGGAGYCQSVTISSSLIIDGGDNSGSLLPGGESDLSGIITGLNSTITEFIPYLVYLGLGIITVIIGFVAIRWLVNRTQAKIRGTFSSGRRRK